MKSPAKILTLTAILSATILSGCSFHARLACGRDICYEVKRCQIIKAQGLKPVYYPPLIIVEFYTDNHNR